MEGIIIAASRFLPSVRRYGGCQGGQPCPEPNTYCNSIDNIAFYVRGQVWGWAKDQFDSKALNSNSDCAKLKYWTEKYARHKTLSFHDGTNALG